MKSKVITPGIADALKRWYTETRLTQEQIAQIAGVNRSSVNGWLSGEAKTIRAVNWVRLQPRLHDYLPPEVDEIDITALPASLVVLEEFRRRIQNAVMDSDLDDATKVKVFSIIRAIPFPQGETMI